MLNGKLREFVDYVGKFREDNVETMTKEDEVCVVCAVAASS